MSSLDVIDSANSPDNLAAQLRDVGMIAEGQYVFGEQSPVPCIDTEGEPGTAEEQTGVLCPDSPNLTIGDAHPVETFDFLFPVTAIGVLAIVALTPVHRRFRTSPTLGR